MFKKTITISVNKDYGVDVQSVVDRHIKLVGISGVYVKGDTLFYTFTTKSSIDTVSKLLEEKLYKCKAKVFGSIIIVDFY